MILYYVLLRRRLANDLGNQQRQLAMYVQVSNTSRETGQLNLTKAL